MRLAEQLAFAVSGGTVVVLIAVIWTVARPYVARFLLRHAIAYRAVAVALNSCWPGAPGCICFPGEERVAYCAGKKHRARKA